MGEPADDAASVIAPRQGEIAVTSATGGTATSAIELGHGRGQYIAVGVDDGATGGAAAPYFWVTFGTSAVAAPDPTATSGTGRTFGPYDRIAHLKPTGDVTHMRVLVAGSGTHYVRHYASSHGGTR